MTKHALKTEYRPSSACRATYILLTHKLRVNKYISRRCVLWLCLFDSSSDFFRIACIACRCATVLVTWNAVIEWPRPHALLFKSWHVWCVVVDLSVRCNAFSRISRILMWNRPISAVYFVLNGSMSLSRKKRATTGNPNIQSINVKCATHSKTLINGTNYTW